MIVYESKANTELKHYILKVCKAIPELSHINRDVFDVHIDTKQKFSKRGSTTVSTLAEVTYASEHIRDWVGHYKGSDVPPYFITVYPLWWRAIDRKRLIVIIHELKHIPDTLRGLIGHTGFGDEDTVKLFQKRNKNLARVFGSGI